MKNIFFTFWTKELNRCKQIKGFQTPREEGLQELHFLYLLIIKFFFLNIKF